MNLLIEAGIETKGPKTKADIRQSSNNGLYERCHNHHYYTHARWVLGAEEETATWARMKFKLFGNKERECHTQTYILKIMDEPPTTQSNALANGAMTH